MSPINRRDFIKLGLATGAAAALGGSPELVSRVLGQKSTQKKLIILGFDGMDPHLVNVWMNQGDLPALTKLRNAGTFALLETGNPPQSPVAWSNFITGMDPGGHGVFDFMHRDPQTYLPMFSAAGTSGAARTLTLGNYQFPLSSPEIVNLRKGRAFWQILEDHDIPATIFKIPSNYPPVPSKQRTLSGMNTPDLYGGYGDCNYYTTALTQLAEDLGGAKIHEVYVIGNQVEARLPGPINSFKKEYTETFIDFRVYLDPVHKVAKIRIQDHEFILKQGEWSDWKRVGFPLIPTQKVKGIVNFYLQEVRPEFKLYVSPINIDPADPAMPISTPGGYSKELERRFGAFYTKGLPADFKALDNNILDDDEYLAQDTMVLEERQAMFDYELDRFDSGLLFYYVSSTDQRQHIFWRHIDEQNPIYDPVLAARFRNSIKDVYQSADRMLDKALQKADKDTTIMVLSDHGFAPFRRTFSLNTWLLENGYHSIIDRRRQGDDMLFSNTDWSKTKAYNYGLNGLYINEKSREAEGTVSPGAEKDNLVQDIIKKLEAFRDPQTGEAAVKKAYAAKDIYHGPYVDQAPDIVVGFNLGYRISWESPAGRLLPEVVGDNRAKWSGDHCMAPDVVPGVFLVNGQMNTATPRFHDITPTILQLFGIKPPENMTGKPVLK
jgi:predicted AlkP superfamily phosphohydrolase/phosphomutase